MGFQPEIAKCLHAEMLFFIVGPHTPEDISCFCWIKTRLPVYQAHQTGVYWKFQQNGIF